MAMPPAARQNFQRNAERWLRMTPAERNVMRQRENLRRQAIKREPIDPASPGPRQMFRCDGSYITRSVR
jgi:hypothetical protein